MIYFDHARTSHPKSQVLITAISKYLQEIGVPPSLDDNEFSQAARSVFEDTRKQIASLFHIQNHNLIFFTQNATYATNMILKGFLSRGDHVIITAYEHNSVVRPLESMKKENISFSVIYPHHDGSISVDDIEQQITPQTKLIIVSHIANSTGYISPIHEIAILAKKHRIALFVDTAQSAGLLDLDVELEGIDFLVFTGHKHLLGPSGVGGGYVRFPENVRGMIQGGSSWGSSHSLLHPEAAPHKFEAGTPNYLGVAALKATLAHIAALGLENIRQKIELLSKYFASSIKEIPNISLHTNQENSTSIVSFALTGFFPGEVANLLFEKYGIFMRSGILCAPLIHKALKTDPNGIVRASFGYSNTTDEIDLAVKALSELARGS